MTDSPETGPDVPQEPYTVLVGVSPTSKSPLALTWGAAQARRSGGRLMAVRVWREPMPPASPSSSVSASGRASNADRESDERKRLEADVASVLGDGHGAELLLLRGGRRKSLLAAARGADLLVIDAPRRPSMSPMFAQRVIYAASCPVVVMPPRISGEPDPLMVQAGKAIGRSALRSAATSGRPGYRPPMER